MKSKLGKKLENYIISPMVILVVKMMVEWIHRNSFPIFFDEHRPSLIVQ